MSLTVTKLKSKLFNEDIIKDFINEQTLIIDRKITDMCRASSDGLLVYQLPVIFPPTIAGDRRAKYIVYTSIIKSLEEREFNVNIKNVDGIVELIIQWDLSGTDKDIDKMIEFLQAHIPRDKK